MVHALVVIMFGLGSWAAVRAAESPAVVAELADPMRPAVSAAAAPVAAATGAAAPTYALSAIKIGGRHARAIINGEMVGEGGHVGSATVRKISSRQVDIATATSTTVLRLNQYEIKRDVGNLDRAR